MAISTISPSDRAREVWLRCLTSAFRTTLACAIVGGATLYPPPFITRQLAFPAFSYVTLILIVTDATLGDTLYGCWHGLYATAQVVGPAILALWLIRPGRLTAATTAAAVAASAFVVALPESTHVVARRIALGQIVIVYVIGFIKGGDTDPVMHPVHVAESTAVGVLACVLALVIPYPILASFEVKKNCILLAENAAERLRLFVKAFCADDKPSALAFISQAKLSATRGTKYLQLIKSKQESMHWERLPIRFLKPHCMNQVDRLEQLDMPLRGMEIALTNPPQILDQELRNGVFTMEKHISQTLKKFSPSTDSPTIPESNAENLIKSLQTLQSNFPQTQRDLPTFFFLFCLKLLQNKSIATSSPNPSIPKSTNSSTKEGMWFFNYGAVWSKKRLIPAFKCSISLGLAVLLGLIYSKEDGYWAGLPVAITFAGGREATFRVANMKAQGTVLGTVYGVLICFVFGKFVSLRFLSLFPWFIFTSFLRHNPMYGQAGGVSAIIGAVLILGRENFGPPSDFAIARIVETLIGLSCSILVEIAFHPKRASTLAKAQLSKSLKTLHKCVEAVSLGDSKNSLGESQKELKTCVNELRNFIGEAELEPNFWFLPFHSASYLKILGSLSKMEDLLLFAADAIELFLEQESWESGVDKKLEGGIEPLRKRVCSSIKCLEEVISVKSLQVLEKELQKKNISYDVELGKSPSSSVFGVSGSAEDEIEKILSSFLQHSKDFIHKINVVESDNEVKTKLALSLSALAFCMGSLARETQEIEKGIKDLLQWENPSCHINLHEISRKIHALYN